MTEQDLVRIERQLNTPTENAEGFAESVLHVVKEVPGLIAEVRRLRAVLEVAIPSITIPVESDVITTNEVTETVRRFGEMIASCLPRDTGFVLAFFATRGDFWISCTQRGPQDETLEALRRMTESARRA